MVRCWPSRQLLSLCCDRAPLEPRPPHLTNLWVELLLRSSLSCSLPVVRVHRLPFCSGSRFRFCAPERIERSVCTSPFTIPSAAVPQEPMFTSTL
eukprot:1992172-Amphidinium_carterae.2